MSASSFLLFLLFLSAYDTVRSGCKVKKFVAPVYYDNGDFVELCFVYFYGCEGDCDNSYEHKVHRENDYDEANMNCRWNHRPCLVQHYSQVSGTLLACSPVDSGQTSQYDSNNPWTVTIKNATSCYCGSTLDGEGAGNCPIN